MREDWVEIELGSISQIYNGNSINAKVKEEKYQILETGLNYIGTKDIGFNGVIDYENGVKIPFKEPKFKIAPKNCVLVCSEGGSAGKKTAYTKENICFGNKLYAIVNKFFVFEGKYVYYYTRYQKFFKSFQNQMNGIIGGVSVKNFSNITIPLAPLLEQKAIVAKIEQLFSELDNGVANLKTAKAKLKIYRQAVLKKAFEGELTCEWREKQTNLPTADELLEQIKKEREVHYKQQLEEWKQAVKDGKKQTKPKKQKELNIELNKITLGSLIEEVKYGTSKKCDYGIDGTAVLRIPNIADGDIDNTDLKFAQFSNEEIAQYKLKTGDILIIRSNGSVKLVGKPALINENDEQYLYAGYLIRLRPYPTILNSKYLYYQLISHELRKQIEEKAKSTSGVNNINSGEIESLLLSIQSITEQNQIVQEIESRLSVCDKIEETIEISLTKSEALRQSILKKAFEGKLLSEQELENIKNHPEYESAEKLLERIKKEKNK